MTLDTFGMSVDLRPTTCLDDEPEESRSLRWIPLAVRYKLDKSLLHLSLDQWHLLPMDVRESLVREPLEGDGAFDELAVSAGACMMRVDRIPPATFAAYVTLKLRTHEAAAATSKP